MPSLPKKKHPLANKTSIFLLSLISLVIYSFSAHKALKGFDSNLVLNYDLSHGVPIDETKNRKLIKVKGPHQEMKLPRTLAIYFPQFHKELINDRLWGEGFTDWDSLRKAPERNRFGFKIPRPTELGYYDLEHDTDVRKRQGELAREYNVDGFIYHHYWFNDDKFTNGPSLHKPLEAMLRDGYPDLPFALNWCAMKWTVTWTSKNLTDGIPAGGVLVQQNFPSPDDASFKNETSRYYEWLRRYFHHSNYIKVNGSPLFMMYQKKPSAVPVLKELRRLAKEDGFPGLFLTTGLTRPHPHLQSYYPFPGVQNFNGREIYNRLIDYPNPSGWNDRRPLEVPEWCEYQNNTLPWKQTKYPFKRTPEIPGIIVAFDNTPRRDFDDANVLSADPPDVVIERFHKSLKAAIHYEICCFPADKKTNEEIELEPKRQRQSSADGDDRFVIINAWNEWAESMTLEPSDVYGRGFLEVVKNTTDAYLKNLSCAW